MQQWDAIVVGAGFGGLAAALTLAEQGRRVLVLEALRYPGGCACTFTRRGQAFDAGATMLGGLMPGQLVHGWLERHGESLEVTALDPVLTVHAGARTVVVPPDRQAWVEALVAAHPEHRAGIERFADILRACADATWPLFDDPALLPPLTLRALGTHATRALSYLPVALRVGRSVGDVLRGCGLGDCAAVWEVVDAGCQITVQARADEAEAPFALGALDFFFRGAAHVAGGPGALAEALVRCVEKAGGTVRFSRRVRHISRTSDRWQVDARGETHAAPVVLANLIPQALEPLLDGVPLPGWWQRKCEAVTGGWGASTRYLSVPHELIDEPAAHHLHLRPDPTAPPVEGHGLLVSVSAASEHRGAGRSVTVSTHVDADRQDRAYLDAVQARMDEALRRYTPHLVQAPLADFTGSPRTFARFTGRVGGWVGGVPRRAGWHNYAELWPRQLAPGLALVGDSNFPGQSTLAAAVGGVVAARAC